MARDRDKGPHDPDAAFLIEEHGQFIRAIYDLERRFKAAVRDLNVRHGLSERSLWILTRIAHGDTRPSDIAESLGILPSSCTVETDKLVRANLIVRETDARDRRAIRLRLTDAGKVLQHQTIEAIDETLAIRFARIPAEDRQRFIALLSRMAEP